MHVAAADPSPVAVDRDGVPAELVDREAELFRRRHGSKLGMRYRCFRCD